MSRSLVVVAILAALGLIAAGLLFSNGRSSEPLAEELHTSRILRTPGRGFGAVKQRAERQRPAMKVERRPRLEHRTEELAEGLAEQPRQMERFADAEEPARSRREPGTDQNRPTSQSGDSQPKPQADESSTTGGAGGGGEKVVVDYSQSALERALTEAGLPPAAAADVKKRYDELAMEEVELRNRARREGWFDTPEFAEELDAIETERLAIRDEIGDDAYDHFLFATGQPNRVYVTGVIGNSPASIAGLQASDVIVRYGGAKILKPDDLIAETEVGRLGEPVRVEITRNGEPLELEVPRGPLGLHIGVTQEPPSKLAR